MARNKKKDMAKIIELLNDTPSLVVVSRKLGIPRSTIYRWMSEDNGFKIEVEKAIELGREATVDLAEWMLKVLINQKDFPAIKYYLEHNSSRYMPNDKQNGLFSKDGEIYYEPLPPQPYLY